MKWQDVIGYFTGADVFISYVRSDSFDYAAHLAKSLRDRQLRPYLDQMGAPPGERVPAPVLAAAKRARVMVVVGSDDAFASEAVQQEIEVFPSHRRPLIPVFFDNLRSAADQPWVRSTAGLAVDRESVADLESGTPSSRLVERIDLAVGNQRQATRLKRAGIGTAAFVLIGLVGLAIVSRQLQRTSARLTGSQHDLSNALVESSRAQKHASELDQNVSRLDTRRAELEKEIGIKQSQLQETTKRADTESARATAQGNAADDLWNLYATAADLVEQRVASDVDCSQPRSTGNIFSCLTFSNSRWRPLTI
jgi:hypothetical protein